MVSLRPGSTGKVLSWSGCIEWGYWKIGRESGLLGIEHREEGAVAPSSTL